MSRLIQTLMALEHEQRITRSLASLVRAELPAIEAARQAGLSYEQICLGFRAMGVQVSARTLRHTVYRIQREPRPMPVVGADASVPATWSARSSVSATLPRPPDAVGATTAMRHVPTVDAVDPAPFARFRSSSPDLDALADRFRSRRATAREASAEAAQSPGSPGAAPPPLPNPTPQG